MIVLLAKDEQASELPEALEKCFYAKPGSKSPIVVSCVFSSSKLDV